MSELIKTYIGYYKDNIFTSIDGEKFFALTYRCHNNNILPENLLCVNVIFNENIQCNVIFQVVKM